MFDINNFLDSYPRFRSVCTDEQAQKVLSQLGQADSIYKMMIASDLGRPALEAMIEHLEQEFMALPPAQQHMFNFQDITVRQAVGSMVQFVLLNFGYTKIGSKSLKKRTYTLYKTASTYKMTDKPRYGIQLKIMRL